MFSQVYYLLRSKQDGQYVAAHPDPDKPQGYLLLFSEHFDALSYLNKHGEEVRDQFTVESIAGSQLKGILQRWGFGGVGMVKDPMIPRVEFLAVQ
ncbi:hypothetical protein [Lyngbya sp. CCY1209]|jgi:hypothetical protein|uniref:hypothetical protein n=1 Tax=Lyngbya sp. CCY1209 TaxID=2886103 RepID=UPI002D20C153|nr:hypothetical protein [Lyngbya sp. CCY1209]MEB3887316.1 hypothetical protein [Lyngbya sp. CCY1209]